MHRPRSRAGRAAVGGAALALVLAGCGNGGEAGDDGPDKATVACRAKWNDLGKEVKGNDTRTNPSALAPRWNNVVATLDYYAGTAQKSDCGEAITKQRAAITALTAFAARLAPYDMELRLEQVRDDAEAYAAAPRPPATTPSPSPKSKNQKKPKLIPAPAPSSISDAVTSLTSQAPAASQQQGPGWEQARVVELSDAAAVAKTVEDLAFLSSESPAYRACTAALAQIRVALAARK